MATDKYKEFRNFMFNELKITRDDIKQWVREAVNDKVADEINHVTSSEFISDAASKHVYTIAKQSFSQVDAKKAIADAISDIVFHRLDIKVSSHD